MIFDTIYEKVTEFKEDHPIVWAIGTSALTIGVTAIGVMQVTKGAVRKIQTNTIDCLEDVTVRIITKPNAAVETFNILSSDDGNMIGSGVMMADKVYPHDMGLQFDSGNTILYVGE